MISRKVKIQIGAFLLVALFGIGYVGGKYAGLDRLLGPRGYVVKIRMADSGGIFTNAEVTYRGVAIGRVGQLSLTDTGIEVPLDINPGAPPIPADARAVVANRSAVGEQYLDLRPHTANGPYLHDGSVIPAERTSTPVPPEMLLVGLDRFAASVPRDSLRTVVGELGTAFHGADGDLRTLLDSTRDLTEAAGEHLPQTQDLLAQSRTVLDTQRAESANILSFSHHLHQVAAQLKSSDSDLRNLLQATPPAAEQTSALLQESGPGLGLVLANLLTTANVVKTRLGGVEQTLVTYPLVTAMGKTVLPGDGWAHLGDVFSLDPLVCTRGYEGTQQRPGNDLSPAPVNQQAHCAEPPGSPTDVRGSHNAPSGGPPPPPARPGQ